MITGQALHELLQRAVHIAVQGHAGQLDKAGQPYIEHPKRVMRALDNDAERIVGVLHDVVEDCGVTRDELAAQGFPPDLLDALDAVTRREDEPYDDFIARAAANPIGRKVKLADLRDNADLARIENPTPEDIARAEKYRRAIARLSAGD
jgi:(p)ppGpp synthase/HD superfamily hydrolase